MFAFFRDGFYRDALVLLIISVLVGSLLSYGVAYAVDSYFGEAVTGLIGDYGQYDVVVHVRKETASAAKPQLEAVLSKRLPGARLKEGLVIAGKTNYFISIPEEFKTREVFEGFSSLLSDIPGASGFTIMTEPSVVVSGVHSSVRSELMDRIEALEGVRLVFRNGSNLVVLPDNAEDTRKISEKVDKIVSEYQILEVRLPLGYQVDDVTSLSRAVALELEKQYPGSRFRDATVAGENAEYEAFVKALSEMKVFLLSYASKVKISITNNMQLTPGEQVVILLNDGGSSPDRPATALTVEITGTSGKEASGLIVSGDTSSMEGAGELSGQVHLISGSGEPGPVIGNAVITNDRYKLARTIEESTRLIEELGSIAAESSDAVNRADEAIRSFEKSLDDLERLQAQLRQLTSGSVLEGGGTDGSNGGSLPSGQELLITLLVNKLFKESMGSADTFKQIENLNVSEMRQSLKNIDDGLENVKKIDLDTINSQIHQLKDSLPRLTDEEIGKSIKLIDRYIQGQVIPGEKIEILSDNSRIDTDTVQTVVGDVLDVDETPIYFLPVGVVKPDARSELTRVLREVRAIIAGLLAIVFCVFSLVLDYSTVLSAIKKINYIKAARSSFLRRVISPAHLYGIVSGSIVLGSIYLISGGSIPFLSPAAMFALGGLLGLLVSLLSERFSPVDTDEILAGEALGLTYAQIMREIVIPSGRPGIMNMLNRSNQKFK